MDSARHNYTFSLRNLVLRGAEVGDHEEFDCISCNGFSEFSSAQSVFGVHWQTYSLKHRETVGVSIWVAVSKVHFVLAVIQFNSETQRIEGSS